MQYLFLDIFLKLGKRWRFEQDLSHNFCTVYPIKGYQRNIASNCRHLVDSDIFSPWTWEEKTVLGGVLFQKPQLQVVLLTHLHGDHCYGLFGVFPAQADIGREQGSAIAGLEGMIRAHLIPASALPQPALTKSNFGHFEAGEFCACKARAWSLTKVEHSCNRGSKGAWSTIGTAWLDAHPAPFSDCRTLSSSLARKGW